MRHSGENRESAKESMSDDDETPGAAADVTGEPQRAFEPRAAREREERRSCQC